MSAEIEIKRKDNYRPDGSHRHFVYSYKSPADETMKRGDGSDFFRPAGTWVEYGTSLTSLRGLLKRKFGRTIKIVEAWR